MQEMHLLHMILQQEKFTFAAIDTEFPGVVLKAPEGLDWWSAKSLAPAQTRTLNEGKNPLKLEGKCVIFAPRK